MTGPITAATGEAGATDAAALAKLGIVRVPTERFEVGPYRYTNLSDALAQARRAAGTS